MRPFPELNSDVRSKFVDENMNLLILQDWHLMKEGVKAYVYTVKPVLRGSPQGTHKNWQLRTGDLLTLKEPNKNCSR